MYVCAKCGTVYSDNQISEKRENEWQYDRYTNKWYCHQCTRRATRDATKEGRAFDDTVPSIKRNQHESEMVHAWRKYTEKTEYWTSLQTDLGSTDAPSTYARSTEAPVETCARSTDAPVETCARSTDAPVEADDCMDTTE